MKKLELNEVLIESLMEGRCYLVMYELPLIEDDGSVRCYVPDVMFAYYTPIENGNDIWDRFLTMPSDNNVQRYIQNQKTFNVGEINEVVFEFPTNDLINMDASE